METSTLKTLRIKRGKTQDEASKIFGITKEYLSMIENGKRNPSDKLKEKMANFYEVSMYDIFYLSTKLKVSNKTKIKQKEVSEKKKEGEKMNPEKKEENKFKITCLKCNKTGYYRMKINYCPYCGIKVPDCNHKM